ncbi:molybdate ABC transporter substrate-binding protein [Brevundimonas sp. R86498]|uniref:molybdate ABC transporter substrate-binding protein n=1 Tax=Brevundimonas sp. R86498 TaxID=3093845 RepID=UPI0037C7C037
MLLGAGGLAACTPRDRNRAPRIDLFAAASLREVLDAAVAEHAQRSGGIVRVSYAGSAQLARQIAGGAPADLFIPADEVWMDWAEERGLIVPGTRRPLAANRLVLIAPAVTADAPLDLTSASALGERLGEGRLAMAEPAVPAGRYGEAALTRLNLWADVRDRIAPAADVRAALALVARGEAPLGVVYATDARVEPRVRVVARFPADSHPAILYPAALVRRWDGEGDTAGAGLFLDGLAGPEGQALFRRFGFVPSPA